MINKSHNRLRRSVNAYLNSIGNKYEHVFVRIFKILAPSKSLNRRLIVKLINFNRMNHDKASYNIKRQEYYGNFTYKYLKNSGVVSIIVPCFNTPKKYFEPLLSSVFSQGYQHWELVLVDASSDDEISCYLKERALSDVRIRYIKVNNEGIAANTNKGIEASMGEYVAFFDHDDTLDPNALAESINLFIRNPKISLVYSDEDKMSDDGEKYSHPHFKPDFSIDMLRNVNYITHFVVVKRDIVNKIGGIRLGFDGAQDYDLLLRIIDENIEVGHVPKILYHWREADGSTAADFSNKKHVTDAGCRALTDHYKRRGIKNAIIAAVENRPGFYYAKFKPDGRKKKIFLNLSHISISKTDVDYIVNCYKKNNDVIKHKIEIILGESSEPDQLVVNGAYIPAAKETDILSLFSIANEDGVRSVSPKITKDGRIFDMGLVDVDGVSKYLFKGLDPYVEIPFGSTEWVRNVDEITGNVAIVADKPGRNIIWSHSGFMGVDIETFGVENKISGFYNPNITEMTDMTTRRYNHIANSSEVNE